MNKRQQNVCLMLLFSAILFFVFTTLCHAGDKPSTNDKRYVLTMSASDCVKAASKLKTLGIMAECKP